MWPATAIDDSDWDGNSARGWTVMDVLRRHRDAQAQDARAARPVSDDASLMHHMVTTWSAKDAADRAAARWTAGVNVLAFLFAHPDSEAMASLDARGEYFDYRTGERWD